MLKCINFLNSLFQTTLQPTTRLIFIYIGCTGINIGISCINCYEFYTIEFQHCFFQFLFLCLELFDLCSQHLIIFFQLYYTLLLLDQPSFKLDNNPLILIPNHQNLFLNSHLLINNLLSFLYNLINIIRFNIFTNLL